MSEASGLLTDVLALGASPVVAAVTPTCHTDFCRAVLGWGFVFVFVTGVPALAALFGLAAWEKRRPDRNPRRVPTTRYVVLAFALGLLVTLAVSDVLADRGKPWWMALFTPALVAPVAWGVSRLRFLG
jgi:hypothetical protein